MGTKDTFLDAYDRYADAIYRHCFFRVFSKAKAEELVQETFMRAWDYLARGERVDNMKAFLYRVATNLIVDEARKRKEVSLDALREGIDFREPSTDGAADIERTVFVRQVRAKMGELDPEDRAILVMRYVDDLDPREIAEILETNANNVSVKLNRAAKKVREML